MTRVLLRLVLIVSLVMNGVGAPWAMVHDTPSGGRDHHPATALHEGSTESDAAGACHPGGRRTADAATVQAGQPGDDPGSSPERSCCSGPDCSCGCMLLPMPARFAPNLPEPAWTGAPVAEPATRAMLRRAAPPFRPPAA